MFRNFNNIEAGVNYLCVNGSETGPMEVCESYGTLQTVFKFVSPKNNNLYNETGTCALTATGDFHIVGKIEEDVVFANYVPMYETVTMMKDNKLKGPGCPRIETEEYIVEGPHFACSDCGNTDWDRFRTIKTETADGTEYDLECSVCESLETEESAEMALHRMAVKLEKYRDAWGQLKRYFKYLRDVVGEIPISKVEEVEKELNLD